MYDRHAFASLKRNCIQFIQSGVSNRVGGSSERFGATMQERERALDICPFHWKNISKIQSTPYCKFRIECFKNDRYPHLVKL